ncbi:hypothetical protein [Luteimonas suaedae]|uniref:hypothetical protein n=1 Tax=Luteimonas suaedae TaxID=2605430 RepID=UPI0011EBA97E|nr:hypothetical protein [Luteimonas suaedae]
MRDDRGEFPFWSMVLAVLLALIAHDLLRLAVGAYMARGAVAEFTRQVQSMPQPSSSPPASASRQRSVSVELPRYPGPISAKASGAEIACINGAQARRVANGWDQDTRKRCQAYSP